MNIPAMINVRRLNRWYGRTVRTRRGDWVLREGWWHWVWHPRWQPADG